MEMAMSINDKIRVERFVKLADFLGAVETVFNAMLAGKRVSRSIRKLNKYQTAINAAKSDDVLRPLAELCGNVYELMTDGKEFDEDKLAKINDLHDEIRKAVS